MVRKKSRSLWRKPQFMAALGVFLLSTVAAIYYFGWRFSIENIVGYIIGGSIFGLIMIVAEHVARKKR